MPKDWNTNGAAAVKEKPTKITLEDGDVERLVGKGETPFQTKVARKPLGVYLSVKERKAIAKRAKADGETMSEWIRNAVRKAAKI
jgi:hypothetical protein